MKFIADLHIHSKYSRATAKNLDPENIYIAARKKGITVVGTGDFTHPGWLLELGEKLEPAEPGLFKLKDDLENACEAKLCIPVKRPVRFILSSEISNIYKKNGATRKLHNLLFFSGFSDVEKFNARLSTIGNLKADGRPILGLDSRNLLEIALETAPDAFLIPAHIWTPWFSLYGSKSGFDSIKECFGDLADHIFAAETGLSSDPLMNWRVPDLDGITLVSNSDAHSPANLGREANLFDTGLSYDEIRRAMKTGDPGSFLGTVEFFPEEGKYHQDGHRKCGINFHPQKSLEQNLICPVCGHELTLGVLHRVEALASRPEGEKPEKTHPFYSLIPLAEVLSELLGAGPKTKKVAAAYEKALEMIGPELDILLHAPKDALSDTGIVLLDEAVCRMREKRVHLQPGYDGEYGKITVFAPDERDRLIGQKNLFAVAAPKTHSSRTGAFKPVNGPSGKKKTSVFENKSVPPGPGAIMKGLNDAQKKAVSHEGGPLLIVAGPGTGKTRTLTCRIAHLLNNRVVFAENILAVTFTNRAAREMAGRLKQMLGENAVLPRVNTFHALCFSMIKDIENTHDRGIVDNSNRRALIREAVKRIDSGEKSLERRIETIAGYISAAKQKLLLPEDDLTAIAGPFDVRILRAVYNSYQDILVASGQYDYDDLVSKTVLHLRASTALQEKYKSLFSHVFIDEYQDLNYAQYCLVRLLVPKNGEICVIGDPDQSIYGFAGSDASFFQYFINDYPGAAVIRLDQNYRSTPAILEAADRIITPFSIDPGRTRLHAKNKEPEIPEQTRINLLTARSDAHEAVLIGKIIEQMIGGLGFAYHDFSKNPRRQSTDAAFSDFAVLYRTRRQQAILAETFDRAGIPYQQADKREFLGQTGVRELICAMKIINGRGSYPDLARLIAWMIPDFGRQDIAALTSWGYDNGYMVNGLLAESHRVNIGGISPKGRIQMQEFLARIAALSAKTDDLPVADKIDRIIDECFSEIHDYGEKHKDALAYLKQKAAGCNMNTAAFLETIALQTDPDFAGPAGEKVSMMTMHAAKGLEFPVVFITGCEDGLIPFHFGNKHTDMNEERRLFYVAVTRAEKILYLCRAESRSMYGKTQTLPFSPYLSEINDLLAESSPGESFTPRAKQVQLTLFS